jgi:AcrR family transcriptional regulator
MQEIRVKKTRQKLIRATESLLQRDGLARVTTRGIAREAGVAEGTLYHHFHGKAGLLHAVAQENMGAFREVLESLPLQVGQRTVRENLEHMLDAAFDSQLRIAPILCSLFADHQLLVRTREILNEGCIGPQRSLEALAAYLQAEQQLGRVAVGVAPGSAAELLLAGSFHAAMLDHLLARQVDPAAARIRLQEEVRTLLAGLEPRISGECSAPKDRNVKP